MLNLTEKAMLVRLSISQWTARKYDKKVSDQVAVEHNTTSDVGRYNKTLLALDAVKAIQKIASEARSYHYEQTLPWEDDGSRILPAANYMHYMEDMRKYKSQFEAAAADLVGKYPALIEEAKRRLNGMFNEADYPQQKNLIYKYGFSITVNPMPAAADFRVAITEDEVRRIQADIEARIKDVQETAMRELWNRLYGAVEHMVDRLTMQVKGQDAVFRDSMISNIADLCGLLPRLNITNDQDLENMRQEVETRLCKYMPHDLRNNSFERRQAAREAQDILNTMAAYMGREAKDAA